MLGLWIAVMLERAQLHGTIEQIDTRVQAKVDGAESLTGDAKALDAPLQLFLDFCAKMATESGTVYTADQTVITVNAPREAGALPIAVVVAVVVGGTLVAGVGVWQAGTWWRELAARHDARAAVADAAEFALQVSDRCRAENRECTPLELQAVQARSGAAATIASNATAPKPSGLFGDISPTDLLLLAAVAGGAWLLASK